MSGFFIGLGVVTGVVAGAMAYLITYDEYRKHFLDGRAAIRQSLQTALMAAAFFFVLSLAAGYVLRIMLATPLS